MRIYTDASYSEKYGIAGIGILVCKGERKDLISNWVKVKSINEAELRAIEIACILSGGEPCEIITDSQIAIQYATKGIADKPRTLEQHIRHKRCEFWACKIRKWKNISFTKVKAHTGHWQPVSIGNNIADSLSKLGVSKYLKNNPRSVLD